jgi:hypothetical protein
VAVHSVARPEPATCASLGNAGEPRVQPGAIYGSGGMHINKRRYIDAQEGRAWAPHHAARPKNQLVSNEASGFMRAHILHMSTLYGCNIQYYQVCNLADTHVIQSQTSQMICPYPNLLRRWSSLAHVSNRLVVLVSGFG